MRKAKEIHVGHHSKRSSTTTWEMREAREMIDVGHHSERADDERNKRD
jgi:hypothetical protein